ncbi:Phenylacetic acid degradation-related protein [Marinobacterium lacunae]|uniref:Phenylacetic acid degradation-related protein n=1 Tax=Marinobacterium lacunae TaxID=1232683 RepID=A0A081FXY5_9GAMM|nr:PaaI family thioesterase [Marinobacterium lacunae]KEA63390.1 Phenylacetic acid degradation-related protein [Marinobacterium lacunae]
MMNFDDLVAFLNDHFPQGAQYGELVELGDGWARMRLPVDDQHLRPGGTVSGPAMMGLADVAVYAALLSRIGPVPLAVTTSLNINFLRRPRSGADILAYAKMLKVGRRLGVGEVYITSDGDEEPVAHATMTYSIPERGE